MHDSSSSEVSYIQNCLLSSHQSIKFHPLFQAQFKPYFLQYGDRFYNVFSLHSYCSWSQFTLIFAPSFFLLPSVCLLIQEGSLQKLRVSFCIIQSILLGTLYNVHPPGDADQLCKSPIWLWESETTCTLYCHCQLQWTGPLRMGYTKCVPDTNNNTSVACICQILF